MVYIQSSGTRSTSLFNSFTYVGYSGFVPRYGINQAVPSTSATSYDYSSLPSATGYSATLSRDPSDVDLDATTPQSVVLSSDVSTVSLIQITALPAATTSSQVIVPKLPYHHVVNILYLVPLFVAAGVALGSVTAVILLKLRKNRRPLLRASTLLPGPPYDNDAEDRLIVHGPPSMESVSLFATGTPSKATVHGSRYVPKRTLGWQLHRATQPTYTHTIIPSNDGEKFTVITQEDPFLVTSPIARESSPPEDMSLPKVHISPPSLEPTSGDNSRVHQSQDNGLPKPFRRSMFDIMKFKGAYRPVHQEYAALTPVTEPVDKSSTNQVRRSSGSKAVQITSPGRNGKARHSPDDHLHSSTSEDALDLLVFQDETQNDPGVLQKQTLLLEPGALIFPTGRSIRKPRKVTPFASERTVSLTASMFHQDELIDIREDEIEEDRDIYTKAPQRTPQKILSASGASGRFLAPDTHTSILPLSSPALMSPPLEESLFFTSSLSSGASLAGGMDTLPVTSPPIPPRVDRTPEFYLFPSPSKRSKAMKKLPTNQPEPPLPYPAHIHAQPTPRRTSNTAESKRRSVSPASPEPKGRSTGAAYRESATGISFLGSLSPTTLAIALASSSSSDVLNKEKDIVAEGYTERRTSMGGGSGSVAAGLSNSD